MSAASNYLEDELLDHVLGKTTRDFTSPSNLYVALFTSDAGLEANAPSAEVTTSGSGYARQSATFNSASGGQATNNGVIQMNTATSNWGVITHMAVMDAATGGNVLFYSTLTATKTVTTGDVFQFGDASITVILQ